MFQIVSNSFKRQDQTLGNHGQHLATVGNTYLATIGDTGQSMILVSMTSILLFLSLSVSMSALSSSEVFTSSHINRHRLHTITANPMTDYGGGIVVFRMSTILCGLEPAGVPSKGVEWRQSDKNTV